MNRDREKTNSVTNLVKIVAKEVAEEVANELMDIHKRHFHLRDMKFSEDRAGETWTEREAALFQASLKLFIEGLMFRHQRTYGSIVARLKNVLGAKY